MFWSMVDRFMYEMDLLYFITGLFALLFSMLLLQWRKLGYYGLIANHIGFSIGATMIWSADNIVDPLSFFLNLIINPLIWLNVVIGIILTLRPLQNAV